jgi:hypothetical protein
MGDISNNAVSIAMWIFKIAMQQKEEGAHLYV